MAFAVPWLGWRGAVEGFAAIGLAAAVLVLLALTNLKIGHTPVPIDKILAVVGLRLGHPGPAGIPGAVAHPGDRLLDAHGTS